MKPLLPALAAALVCSLNGPVNAATVETNMRVAQTPARPSTTRPPASAQPASPPAAPPAQAPGNPGEQPAQTPPPPVPTRTEILNFDNWSVTCREFAEGKKKRACTAQTQVTQSGSNQVVLVWTVGHDEKDKITSVLTTPTGVLIAPGVEVRLGKAATRKAPFAFCDNGRCTATLNIDQNAVRDITNAGTAEVVIHAPNVGGIQFSFPVKGFDKAYAEVIK